MRSHRENPAARAPRSNEAVDANRLFSALRNPRARKVLASLSGHEGPMSLRDLAEEVATSEHERPVADVPAETVDRVHLDLYHVQVPKLEGAGVVESHDAGEAVSRSEEAADLTRLLDDLASP